MWVSNSFTECSIGLNEAQSAIQEGILQPFQCQINRRIKASSAHGDLILEDAKNLVDGEQNLALQQGLKGKKVNHLGSGLILDFIPATSPKSK